MLKLKQFRPVMLQQTRWKNRKNHWSVLNKKKFPTDRALENFDDFYGSVFGKDWRSIRIALLTKHKYIAMVNNFGETEKTCSALMKEGAINVRSLLELAEKRLLKNHSNVENTASNDGDIESTDEMSNKMNDFIKEKENSETRAIYPPDTIDENTKNFVHLKVEPNTDNYNRINIQCQVNVNNPEEELNSSVEIVDYRKSLAQTFTEDLEIDLSRLVNLQHGTGGLHEYVPATNIKGMEDWIPESDHYKYYSTTNNFPVSFYLEKVFKYPENLHLYTYEKGNCSTFVPPSKCETGVYSHFLINGASILPPLLLNIKQSDVILDACAAPGGKSLIMLQTLYPDLLICNDIQENRLKRVRNVMKQYIIDFEGKWENKYCSLTHMDARTIDDYEEYDKILVDVPCTIDRHSVMENDNNIFKPTRIKERLKLPELQSAILANCIRLLKPGGTLIYSTCSLSPVQNDGVVHMALQKVFTDHNITTTIVDLSLIVQMFGDIFKFETTRNLQYGQLVLPILPANFGPMYLSKITRN